MRTQMRLFKNYTLAFILFSFCCFGQPARSWAPISNVVVWDFSYVGSERPRDSFTARITGDVEAALVAEGKYKVLERSQLNELLLAMKEEDVAASISGLSPRSRQTLARLKADAVVFGYVEVDPKSGNFLVSAKLVSFDRRIHWSLSYQLSKTAQMQTAESRRIASSKLKIGPTLDIPRTMDFGEEFSFELSECERTNRRLQCALSVTNSGADRVIRVLDGEVVDDSNRQVNISEVTLANSTSGVATPAHLLVSGRPADLKLTFQNADHRSELVARLNLHLRSANPDGSGHHDFRIQLQNIPLKF
jgi:hypothetical protein